MSPYKYLTPCAAMLLLCACGAKTDETAATAEEDEIAIIDIDVAHTRAVPQSRSYTANVEAYNINNIAPSMANRIREIRVDVGDHVSRGQVLVTLDAANADQQRIALEDTEREYNRALELLEIGAGTQRAVDQLKAQLDAARRQYRNTMDNTVLTAPVAGVVTERNYDPGDMTGQLPVLTIGQITPSVKLVINVNEQDLSVIKNGMEVEISFDAYEGERFSGKISRISPAVDVASRTFPVEVTLPNPGERLRPGMFGRVVIGLGTRDNVVVPDRAVVKQAGSNNKYVYTYSAGTVGYHRVELGSRLDDGFELLSGINDGDTVVIAGQVRLSDGAQAKILERNTSAK